MDNLMPLHFLWSEVERLMEIRGVAHRDQLAELSKGMVKPSLPTLGKLCQALRCQPGDLLQFVYEDENEESS